MADRPIIFSAPMVRALLDGRKTQTRRIYRVPPGSYVEQGRIWAMTDGCPHGDAALPYAPGDRLWVREAFWRDGPGRFRYRASGHVSPFGWHPPQRMGRPPSRLTLLVTDVRVQRLQEISAEDVTAEGIPFESDALAPYEWSVSRFADLWNSIHGHDAWDANPWVAAISFETHRCNIDTMEEGTW